MVEIERHNQISDGSFQIRSHPIDVRLKELVLKISGKMTGCMIKNSFAFTFGY